MSDIKMPVLDPAHLAEIAQKAAVKAAESEINDFYNGYSSPFKKAVREHLEKNIPSIHFDVVDIVKAINIGAQEQINMIAQESIARTYLPMLKKMLTRTDETVKFSDLLKEFIDHSDFDVEDDDPDMYEVEIYQTWPESPSLSEYQTIKISNGELTYEFNEKMVNEEAKDGTKSKFLILKSLPKSVSPERFSTVVRDIKLDVDGTELKIPFEPHALNDAFVNHCAALVISKSKIVMDVDNFNEDLFPERGHCSC
jgi:hypothetical protein